MPKNENEGVDDMLSTGGDDQVTKSPPTPQPAPAPSYPRMSVGRIVHYYSDTTHDGVSGPFAAMVVAERDEGRLALHVFGVQHDFHVDNVPFDGAGRHWEIPPRV